MTYLAYRNWKNKGKKIFANYRLNYVPYYHIKNITQLEKARDGYFVCDELWVWLDTSMTVERRKREFIKNILRVSRKRKLTYCVHPDELVICNPSTKKISDVTENDKVLTHTGNFRKVKETMSRYYEGDMYTITPRKLAIPQKLTGEHPVYTALPTKDGFKFVWRDAKDLTPMDFLAYPIVSGVKDIDSVKISDYYTPNKESRKSSLTDKVMKEANGDPSKVHGLLKKYYPNKADRKRKGGLAYTIRHRMKNGYDTKWKLIKGVWGYKNQKIPDKINITNDFMKLSGYFVSDGCASTKRCGSIQFGFNIKEMHLAKDVKRMFKELFNVNCKINTIEKNNVIIVRFACMPIAKLFEDLFGKYAHKKRLPLWFLKLPLKKQQCFIEGYFLGDGHHDKKRGVKVIVTTSPNMAQQLMQMYFRNGKIPSLYRYNKNGSKGRKPLYHIHLYKKNLSGCFYNDKLIIPIKNIQKEHYQGDVYNMEVEKDHSFCSLSLTNHNCFTVQTLEQMPDKIRKIIDLIAVPSLNRKETMCKLDFYAGPRGKTKLKTLYFPTAPVKEMFNTDEEIETLQDDVMGSPSSNLVDLPGMVKTDLKLPRVNSKEE